MQNNSRPDFYFEWEGQAYLIEVKIYDQNDHFDQSLAMEPPISVAIVPLAVCVVMSMSARSHAIDLSFPVSRISNPVRD